MSIQNKHEKNIENTASDLEMHSAYLGQAIQKLTDDINTLTIPE